MYIALVETNPRTKVCLMFFLSHPEDRFLFAPNEPAAAAPATPAAAAPASETPASATPSAASVSTTQTPAQSSGTTSTPAAGAGTTVTPPAAAASWLDSFRSEGFQATDEATARTQLLQSHRDAERLRPLAPALSAYQQHASEFHKWLADRQKAQAAPAATESWTKKLGWNHPEYSANWKHQVHTDDKGNIVANDGAPADLAMKYQQATQYRQEFIEKFLTDPGEALKPYMEHIAKEQAQQFADQGVGQYREKQEATSFIDKHQSWLFDQVNGAAKTIQQFNPQTGQYDSQKVLSNYGKAFVQHLQVAAQNGFSPEMQQNYALQAVQNQYMASPEYGDYLVAQRATATPGTGTPADPRAAANAAFIAKQNPAKVPTQGAPGNTTPAPVKVTRENLEQVMLARIQAEGASTS